MTPEKYEQIPAEYATPPSTAEEEDSTIAAKNLQKRINLRNMILQKFRIKYNSSVEKENGELIAFIVARLDDLFSKSAFDERDLIKIDKEIQERVNQANSTKKNVQFSDGGKAASIIQTSRPEQATLKKIEMLDELKS